MRQLVQSVRSGELRVVEAPDPLIGPAEVLVQTTHSVVSAGTERAVRELASASLLSKARARPDLVKQVIRKARDEGVRATSSAVRSRLDEEMPLGYSGAGVVVKVGEAVAGVRPGMRVATGGAGHGDLQVVAGLLTVPIPDGVTNDQAAFATVASIALHGLRMADVGPGSSVCVVGLGLIGQLTVRLAMASGLRVYGVDLREWTVEVARQSGATASVERGVTTTQSILDWSRGRGVDAVLLTAATDSSDPALLAPARLRDRGTIVVVGDVGMQLRRTPLYEKEISVKVARSYGPGRYDRSYEQWGVDYPLGFVPFSEGRNLETVLDLMATGRLAFDDLITHRFDFDRFEDAYGLLSDRTAEYLGIQLTYPEHLLPPANVSLVQPTSAGSISLIGAGVFASSVLIPAIASSGFGRVVSVSSASGTTAARLAGRVGVEAVSVDQAIDGSGSEIVVIATSHDSHAQLVARALRAGKHVYCEKPLALTDDELDDVTAAWTESGGHLAVGFNRRFSPDLSRAFEVLDESRGPVVMTYRVSAGRSPKGHWYEDRRQGGRLLGEVCHFIDACIFIAGSAVRQVVAFGNEIPEALLSDDFAVAVTFDGGSMATISYGSTGHPATRKERLEILGRGHSIVIDDYAGIEIDGKSSRHTRDKGHHQCIASFLDAVRSGGPQLGKDAITTSRVVLDAAASLSRLAR